MSNQQLDAGRRELIAKSIRAIPDFPKKGILFQDVTTMLLDHNVRIWKAERRRRRREGGLLANGEMFDRSMEESAEAAAPTFSFLFNLLSLSPSSPHTHSPSQKTTTFQAFRASIDDFVHRYADANLDAV